MAQDDRHPRLIRSTPRMTREEIANQAFPQSFRGISEPAVRAFLRRLADEHEALQVRQDELFAEVERLEAGGAADAAPPEEQDLIAAVGEETARVLRSAKESAEEIRQGAEARAGGILKEAADEARSIVEEAEQAAAERTRVADESAAEMLRETERLARELQEGAEARVAEFEAETGAEARSELESARRRSKELVGEAQATRDRMLQELSRRREALESQVDALRTGRDRLLEAYRVVKRTLDEASEALRSVDARVATGEAKKPRITSPALPVQHLAAEEAAAEEAAAEQAAAEQAAAEAAREQAGPGEAAVEDAGTRPEEEPVEEAPPQRGPARVAAFALGELDTGVAAPPDEPPDEAPDEPPDASEGPNEETADEPPPSTPAPSGVTVLGPDPEPPSPEAAPDRPEPAPAAEPAGRREEVDELFARLKARAEEPSPPEPVAGQGEPEVEPEPVPAAPEPARDEPEVMATALLRTRSEALEPLVDELVRGVKRVVRDEQNLVLEAVREFRGTPTAEDVLPAVADQDEAFAAATAEVVFEACAAGERVAHDLGVAGGTNGDGAKKKARARELATELARELMDPLRGKLGDALREVAGGDEAEAAERVRARYRDWKNQRIDASARNALAAAFARGLYEAVPEGVPLRWVTTDPAPCPDCADNALEETPRGKAFPTGHLVPPAHPGCHCMALPAEVPAEVQVG